MYDVSWKRTFRSNTCQKLRLYCVALCSFFSPIVVADLKKLSLYAKWPKRIHLFAYIYNARKLPQLHAKRVIHDSKRRAFLFSLFMKTAPSIRRFLDPHASRAAQSGVPGTTAAK